MGESLLACALVKMDFRIFFVFILVFFGSPLPPSINALPTPVPGQIGSSIQPPIQVTPLHIIIAIAFACLSVLAVVCIGLFCAWLARRTEVEEIWREDVGEFIAAGKTPMRETKAEREKRIRLEMEREDRRRRRVDAVPVERDPRLLEAGLHETPSMINAEAIKKRKNRGKLLPTGDVDSEDIATEHDMTWLLEDRKPKEETTVQNQVQIGSEVSIYKVAKIDSARQIVPEVEKNLIERDRQQDEESAKEEKERRKSTKERGRKRRERRISEREQNSRIENSLLSGRTSDTKSNTCSSPIAFCRSSPISF